MVQKILVFIGLTQQNSPIFDFCEIRELFNVKADHILGWTGRYTTVHQEFPRESVSLKIEKKYRDTYRTENHKRYATLIDSGLLIIFLTFTKNVWPLRIFLPS